MAIDSKALTRSWLHSHEEDSADHVVYRPETFDFPPSRGRSGFELKPDRTLIEFGPGPTDRTTTREGRWDLQADDHLAFVPAGSAGPERTMKIVSVSPAKLVLAKRSPSDK
jgi:hypothetical protein